MDEKNTEKAVSGKTAELNNIVDSIINELDIPSDEISSSASDEEKAEINNESEIPNDEVKSADKTDAPIKIDDKEIQEDIASEEIKVENVESDNTVAESSKKAEQQSDDSATIVMDAVNEKKPAKHLNADFLHSLEEKKVEAPGVSHELPDFKLDKTVNFKLNEKYSKKALPNTDRIDIDKKQLNDLDKDELAKKRKNKVRDFVLINQDEEDAEEKAASQLDEYTEISQARLVFKKLNNITTALVLRLVVLIATSSILSYIAFAYDNNSLFLPDFISKTSPIGYISFNVILGIISCMCALPVIFGGFAKLFTMKSDADTVCALSCVFSILVPIWFLIRSDSIVIDNVVLYVSIAVVGLLFNTIGKLVSAIRIKRNFRFVSGISKKYGISNIESDEVADAFTKGSLVDFPQLSVMRETEFLTNYLKTSNTDNYTKKLCKISAPVSVIAAIVVAVACGLIYKDLSLALSAFAGTICIASPFSTYLLTSVPLARSSSKIINNSAIVSSYSSADEFADTNSVLLNASSLFPDGSINLVAFKIFGSHKADEAFLYASSLCLHSDSVLSHIFYDVIGGKVSMLKRVENFVYEDSMGMGAWIDNKRILLGSRELMKNHGIAIPSLAKEQRYVKNDSIKVVYISISGEIAAVFHIEMKPSLEIADQIKQLDKHDINIMLKTVDSIVTVSNIAELFDISPNLIKILPFRLHNDFDSATSYIPKTNVGVACDGKFPSFASALVSCKRIRRIVHFVSTLHFASMILGVLLFSAFALLSAVGYFAPSTMVIYYLAWAFVIAMIEVDAV